jgi:hypothetical protein
MGGDGWRGSIYGGEEKRVVNKRSYMKDMHYINISEEVADNKLTEK